MQKEYNFDTLDYGKARIIINNDSITILRSGLMAKMKYGHTGERTFMIDQISAVELKEAGLIMGHIQFIIAGTVAKKQPLFASQKDRADDNTVMFSNKNLNSVAREIKEYIENYKSNASSNNANVQSAAAQVKELKELLDMGAISQEEFDKKKKELLKL